MFPVQLYAWDHINNKRVELHRDKEDGLVITPHIHHKIHNGDSYEWSNRWTGLNSGNRDYLLVCGTVELHFFLERLIHTNDLNGFLYLNPTISANGTEITGGNRNWGSNNTTTTKIYVGPTVTNVGTLKNEESSFANNNTSSVVTDVEERIIIPGQKALLRLTRVAGTVNGSIRIVGYEGE